MNQFLDHFNTLFLSYGDLVYDENHFILKVVDTPGILDHSLEERNTIEMQVRYIHNFSLPCATFLLPNFFFSHIGGNSDFLWAKYPLAIFRFLDQMNLVDASTPTISTWKKCSFRNFEEKNNFYPQISIFALQMYPNKYFLFLH